MAYLYMEHADQANLDLFDPTPNLNTLWVTIIFQKHLLKQDQFLININVMKDEMNKRIIKRDPDSKQR